MSLDRSSIILSKSFKRFVCEHETDVRAICKPLFTNTQINYFDYNLHYYSGEYFVLSSHPQFHINYLKEKLYVTQQELQRFLESGQRITILSENNELPTGASDYLPQKYQRNIILSKHWDIYHRLYFVIPEKEYIKVCGFGASSSATSIYEFLLNSIDLLEQFIYYFEYQAYSLISKGKTQKLKNLPGYLDIVKNETEACCLSAALQELFFCPKKFIIPWQKQELEFTRKEMQTIALAVSGFTAKEIALKLHVSIRTVENRLYRLKQRTGTITRQELRAILTKHRVFKLFGLSQ